MGVKSFTRLVGAAVVAVVCWAGTVGAQTTWNIGTVGDSSNVIAVLSDGTLTISGEGAMRNFSTFSPNLAPWRQHVVIRDMVNTVIIEDGVTSIGSYAFTQSTNLASVTIPGSVETIGNFAFERCSTLTSVTISEGVRSIGISAFQGNTGLTSITIPNSVETIEASAFRGNTGLTSITIPNGVETIGNDAFRGNTGLTSITIPNSVETIGNGVFRENTGLTSITIPENIRSIGNYAFAGCAGLTSLTIPGNVETIGTGAFGGCSNLASVTISEGVISIGTGAFGGCTTLTTVTVPNSVTTIERDAFGGCNNLTTATIGNGATSISHLAFLNSPRLASINVDAANTAYTSLGGVLFDKNMETLILYPEGRQGAYIIPYGVVSIREGAFNLSRNLTTVTIPSSVTTIELSAFLGSNLTSITIPNSVTEIGQMAFMNCNNLTSITLPNSITKIESSSFSNTGLISIDIPYGVTTIENAFNNNYSLTTVTIPSSVTSIGSGAFASNPNLTSVAVSWLNPLGIGAFTFSNTNTAAATLYVPEGTVEAYRNAPVWSSFGNITDDDPPIVSIVSIDREIPTVDVVDEAVVTPRVALTGELVAGPNPVGRSSDGINFFWQGKRINDGALTVFDAFGNVVNKIEITDGADCKDVARNTLTAESTIFANSRRVVGSWDLTDSRGRLVSEGTYLVRGTVVTSDGKRERVSVVLVGVR